MADEITAQYNGFKKFLLDIGINARVIENYLANLSKIDENFLQKHAGCKSVYQMLIKKFCRLSWMQCRGGFLLERLLNVIH